MTECGIETESVTRGLSVQWNCPVLTTERFSPETMALALPQLFIEKYGILPLRVAGSKILYAGFEGQFDASTAFAVGQMSGLRTECGVVGEAKFRAARKLLLECRFAEVTRRNVPDRDMLVRAVAKVLEQRQPRASKLVRLHQHYWLRTWSRALWGRCVAAFATGRRERFPVYDRQRGVTQLQTHKRPAISQAFCAEILG